ncbi:MAG: hypothetical protein MUO54_10435 [Anaerolineales bacterium]|nr:hypothetical protein [Anaerolineales bacterium]
MKNLGLIWMQGVMTRLLLGRLPGSGFYPDSAFFFDNGNRDAGIQSVAAFFY